jgi:hypothetical protein
MNISKLFSMLACPFKILANIPLCSYYWFLDVVFYIIWLILWLIIFIFIFCPLKLEFAIFCTFFGKIIDFCPTISMNDLCPSKKQFFNTIENINNLFSSKRFLFRNKSDVKKCYCMPPIKILFGPLTSYKSFEEVVAESSEKSDSSWTLFISFGILCLLYLGSLSYYGTAIIQPDNYYNTSDIGYK